LRELTFAEVRRALQALSRLYVQRRERILAGAALDGAGKRAAFALFYAPLHFLVLRRIVGELGLARAEPATILDLGCGSGAGGAAWAVAAGRRPWLSGIDLNPWAVSEANWTWSWFGLSGRARVGRLERSSVALPEGGAILLAYTAGELSGSARDEILPALLEAPRRRTRVLVVEPIARRIAPWWDEWAGRFAEAGGRTDSWRFAADLPERLRLLDRAAGLDHQELTARSLLL
jgi:hypothetical protein